MKPEEKVQKPQAAKNGPQLPDELKDQFEIVGTWPEGDFKIPGLEVTSINFSKLSKEMADHLVKIKFKGLKKIEAKK